MEKIKLTILKSKGGYINSSLIKGEDYFSNEKFTLQHALSLPSEEAYLINNPIEEIISIDNSNPKKSDRRIFSMTDEWTEFEKEQVSEFKKFFITKNYQLPQQISDEILLRFLQPTGFNYSKSYEYIVNHIEWRNVFFPFELNPAVIDILQSGFMYTYGRDKRFRPILIIRVELYIELSKKYKYEDFLKAVIYFTEYLINHLLIPGQVEDWVVITDLRNASIFSIPKDFNDFVKVMQSNYRARLRINFVIGMNIIFRGLWSIIKNFMDPNTNKKVRILGNDYSEIYEYIRKDQVEKRFGGEKLDLVENFFPPTVVETSPKGDETKLYDEEIYNKLVSEKKIITPSPYLKYKYDEDELD